MKLSKKNRRQLLNAIDEATRQVEALYEIPMSFANLGRLDIIRLMLTRISSRLEGKHGKRRHD
jgi:hypothetical protein